MSAALLLVGNPGSRRTALLTAALARAGHGAPRVVPWRTVLADGPDRAGTHLAAAFAGGAVSAVRVDSPGDDPEVDRRLRGADTCAAHGAVTTGPDWYGGFTAATTAMAAAARAAGVPATTDPRELAVLFDKAACHTVLAAAGVPVPQALDAPGAPPVTGWVDLRDRLTARGWHRVFVKPAHGSSASGVLAVQLRRRGTDLDVIARGPVELDAGRPFNTLRPGVFRGESAVAPLIDALADRRLHVERWFPKLVHAGRAVDVRVLVVAGTATHAVVRTATGPITNLHLGNARGDLDTVRALLGVDGWRAVLTVAEHAAACFPRTLTVGVDVLVGATPTAVAVAEVNAFGDLLPNLPGLTRPDHDPYDAQVAALTERTLL